MIIEVLEDSGWAKKGEVHNVLNEVVDWNDDGFLHFQKGKGIYGIPCHVCKILPPKQLTRSELVEIVGFNFEIID